MPRIDELPVPAQNQIRAQRGEVEETGPEKQRMTLLQRLAQVGLGRRDDSEAQEQRTPRPNGSNCRRCPNASRSGCRIRSRNTPSGRPRRPRRVSISTAGRPCLCTSLWMTISSKFRRSCAARPIESADLKPSAIPAADAGIGREAALNLRFAVMQGYDLQWRFYKVGRWPAQADRRKRSVSAARTAHVDVASVAFWAALRRFSGNIP